MNRTLLVGLVLALTACQSPDTGYAPDAGTDTGADVGHDTTDASPDVADGNTGTDGDDASAPDASPGLWVPPAGPHILGARSSTATTFWAAPWPDEARVPGAQLPNPGSTPLVDQLNALASSFGGVSSAVFLPTTHAIDPLTLPQSAAETLGDMSTIWVVATDAAGTTQRLAARVGVLNGAGPHAPPHAIVVQPLQGYPWPAGQSIAVYATTAIRTVDGVALEPSGYSGDVPDATSPASLAGVARFVTGRPTREFRDVVDDVFVRGALDAAWTTVPVRTEDFGPICVFEGAVEFTQFQQGTPPFSTSGGQWAFDDAGQIIDGSRVTSRVWFSVPRDEAPLGGFGVVQFIRVGGGGDRPLIDRGVRDSEGFAEPGTGLAVPFARAGFVGMQFDGPHGGPRNPTAADEQFLMFNINNPVALRDNVRQTALEVALLGDWLRQNAPLMACEGYTPAALDLDRYALFGHSMGATVAPIAATAIPDLDVLLLSGAGGSWIENVLHKQAPLAVRPLAETILELEPGTLTQWDPALNLLQQVGEPADPQVYAASLASRDDLDVLMIQGIVDTYILPPIANAISLPLDLTLAGEALEATDPRTAGFDGFVQANVNPDPQTSLPAVGKAGERFAILVQHVEDGIENGHEVAFQLGAARRQLRCMLSDRIVVDAGAEGDPCR